MTELLMPTIMADYDGASLEMPCARLE